MGIGKLSFRLMGTHVILSLIEFFLLVPLMGFWEDKQVYQWLIGLILIFAFWLIIYSDISYTGENDLKRNIFWRAKGFVIGLIASIPPVLLFISSLLISTLPNLGEILLRFWLTPYVKLFIFFSDSMPYFALVPIFLFPVITGFSYLDGQRKRKKTLDTIQESSSKRAEKSKVDKVQ